MTDPRLGSDRCARQSAKDVAAADDDTSQKETAAVGEIKRA